MNDDPFCKGHTPCLKMETPTRIARVGVFPCVINSVFGGKSEIKTRNRTTVYERLFSLCWTEIANRKKCGSKNQHELCWLE